MTPDEEQPLLQEPAPEQPEWKKRVYIAASALGGILVLLILLAYNWLIPAQIQEALNGSGTLVNRVHIKSIDGNKTSLLLDLTIPVQPPFTTCYLDQTELEFSVPFDDDDEAVGSFVLPRITAYPKQSKIDLQFESDFVYDDIPLLSYLITQAVKHQIYPKSVQFLGNPRVVVPLLPFGSWAGVLKRVYSSGPAIELSDLNASVEDVVVKTDSSKIGTRYTVDCNVLFDNPTVLSLELSNKPSFSVWYENVPILKITVNGPKLSKKTKQPVHIVSIPQFTNELMTLVGKVAEGMDQQIQVRDIDLDLGDIWLQDVVDGFSIPITVPGAQETFLNGPKESR